MEKIESEGKLKEKMLALSCFEDYFFGGGFADLDWVQLLEARVTTNQQVIDS